MNKPLLFIAACLLAFNAFAQPPRMDFVTSVKLDGVELAQPVNIQKLPKAFWVDGITKMSWVSECSANGEVYIDYKNRSVKLEFFPEDNPGIDLDGMFTKKTKPYRKYPLKAQIWVDWKDMRGFTESLKVDDKLIKPDLTFEEFKRIFPVSAAYKYPLDELLYEHAYPGEEWSGAHMHDVTIGESDPDIIEPPYMGSVRFFFKAGKLVKLQILQGIAC